MNSLKRGRATLGMSRRASSCLQSLKAVGIDGTFSRRLYGMTDSSEATRTTTDLLKRRVKGLVKEREGEGERGRRTLI